MSYKEIEDRQNNAREYYKENKHIWIHSAEKNKKRYNTDSSYREHRLAIQKKSYYKNHEKSLANRRTYAKQTNSSLKMYGLSIEQYNALLNKQNGVCAICSRECKVQSKRFKEGKSNRPLIIDHCHKTNKIRGLLCSNCNIMIGMAEDNINLLQKAIDYLK